MADFNKLLVKFFKRKFISYLKILLIIRVQLVEKIAKKEQVLGKN